MESELIVKLPSIDFFAILAGEELFTCMNFLILIILVKIWLGEAEKPTDHRTPQTFRLEFRYNFAYYAGTEGMGGQSMQ